MYRVQAPAKINVSLRILAQEASGYHQLETVFAAVGLADDLTLGTAGSGIELEVSGADLGDPRRNLVYQAAEIFLLRAGIEAGVRIRLEKRIPHGAGLGGGSSDAAAALRLLQAAFGDPLGEADLLEIAGGLGSNDSSLPNHPLAIGAAVAFGVGLISLNWLLRWVERGQLYYFAWWCIPLGLGVIAWQLALRWG